MFPPGFSSLLQKSLGYITQTPMQSIAIPKLLASTSHTILAAQTGTGKTIAYTSVIHQAITENALFPAMDKPYVMSPSAIIFLPNKPLEAQVAKLLVRLGMTAEAFPSDPSIPNRLINTMPDVCLAHPTTFDASKFSWSRTKLVVLDEVDLLLDQEKSRNFFRKTLKQARHIFVSATLKGITEGREEKSLGARSWITRSVGPDLLDLSLGGLHTVPCKQEFIRTSGEDKDSEKLGELKRILSRHEAGSSVLVFVNSRIKALALKQTLIDSDIPLSVDSIVEKADVEAFAEFTELEQSADKADKISVVVCTDIASRGIDFDSRTNLVVNYDFPFNGQIYLHRCGRTARAGREGSAKDEMLAGGIEKQDGGGLEYVMGRRRSFNKRIKKKRREAAKKLAMSK